MRKISIFLVVFISIVNYYKASAQRTPFITEKDNLIDFPVSLNTGTASITIPLFSFAIGDQQIPVSLNYNATGIKYNQQAGEAGLGWDLSPYYRVSQEIRGNIFGTNLSQSTLGTLETYLGVCSSSDRDNNLIKFAPKNSLSSLPGFINAANATTFSSVSNLRGEHDIYRYSLADRGGAFVWLDNNHANEILLLDAPKNNIKLEETFSSGNPRYKIVDDKGWKYTFGENNSIDAGYLTADNVYDSKGDVVHFDYNLYYLPYKSSFQSSVNVIEGYVHPVAGGYNPNTTVVEDTVTTVGNGYYNNLVTQITWQNGRASFSRGSSGLLNQIIIYKDGTLTEKTINFYYSKHSYNDADFLDSVEVNHGEQTYRFNYNDGVASGEATFIANKTFAIDHWGYYWGGVDYNGMPGVPTYDLMVYNVNFQGSGPADLYAQLPGLGAISSSPFQFFTPRNGQAYSMFSLQKVTYPGGGSKEFVYEPHSENGLRIKEIITNDGLGNLAGRKIYTYGNSSNYANSPNYQINELYTEQKARIGAFSNTSGVSTKWALYNTYRVSNQASYLNNKSVYYYKVTEQNYDPSGLTGKVEYNYSEPGYGSYANKASTNLLPDIVGRGLTTRNFPVRYQGNESFGKTPVLDSVVYYKNDGGWKKVKRIENTYQWFQNPDNPSLINLYTKQYASMGGWPSGVLDMSNLSESTIYTDTHIDSFFDYGFYMLYTNWSKLLKTKVTEYHD